MSSHVRRVLPNMVAYLDDRLVRWRTGAVEGQVAVLAALMVLSTLMLFGSLIGYSWVPAAAFVLPMLLGSLMLRWRPLAILISFIAVCVTITVTNVTHLTGMTLGRVSTLVVLTLTAGIVLFESSRHRSGLPGPLGEAMLVDLRDRLQAQGVVPALPDGWMSQSAMASAGGARFAGDFLVANLSDDESCLEMILVDVCGKGVSAGTQSLQFAGALGGLIGSLPPMGLFAAGNDYLLRQQWDEGFATAVHVIVNLESGSYSIICAGHPPALRWSASARTWEVDGARGTALGITKRPEFHRTTGDLLPGDALMFYTDGVVESRTLDFEVGIDRLRTKATTIVKSGFDGAAKRILRTVDSSDDDRAVLILSRSL